MKVIIKNDACFVPSQVQDLQESVDKCLTLRPLVFKVGMQEKNAPINHCPYFCHRRPISVKFVFVQIAVQTCNLISDSKDCQIIGVSREL